ncbi:DUF6317 family protein [Streptomyces silvisoli]|uniref:DUF6317 family protein n=1 Tax=Streptomyces silvisoli TaxID=3034235 RepID=A0ABT5ZSN2_9ACTN|nr:DUF6317 family protein [Streptomyces silvisoli]MDF3292043.1 DUF6317 family protein [Streptomyces silvisoli]
MSADFQVIHADIMAMSKCFGNEADDLDKLRHLVAPTPTTTGDADLDTILASLLTAFGALHEGIVRKLHGHARSLKTAGDHYQSNDADVARLLDSMIKDAG